MPKYKFLIIMLLACFSGSAFERPEVKNVQFYNAGSENISFEELREIEDSVFRSLDPENVSQGFTTNHYWLRFTLSKPVIGEDVFYLKTGRPVTDEADLYQEQENGWKLSQSGDQLQFSSRDVAHRSTFFKVPKWFGAFRPPV